MTSTSPSVPDERTASARPRIVVGVDGSACGATALAWALRQALLLGADVDAVACWQPPPMVSGAAGLGAYADFSTYDLTEHTTELLEKALAAALADAPDGDAVTVRSQVFHAYPAHGLLQAAEGADLLVVGSRGHGELSGMLLGSVGLHCATHATCPVVIVRGSAPVDAADE